MHCTTEAFKKGLEQPLALNKKDVTSKKVLAVSGIVELHKNVAPVFEII